MMPWTVLFSVDALGLIDVVVRLLFHGFLEVADDKRPRVADALLVDEAEVMRAGRRAGGNGDLEALADELLPLPGRAYPVGACLSSSACGGEPAPRGSALMPGWLKYRPSGSVSSWPVTVSSKLCAGLAARGHDVVEPRAGRAGNGHALGQGRAGRQCPPKRREGTRRRVGRRESPWFGSHDTPP